MPTRFCANHRPSRVTGCSFLPKAADPDIISHHVPHTLFFQFAVKALAGLLGCEPKPEAVLAERDKLGQQGWAEHLIRDANISGMLMDYGFQSKESYPHDELTKLLPCRVEPILRLETLAQKLILRYDTYDQVLDAFIAEVEGAQKAGYVALKSIIAYRTGLNIRKWPPQ